MSSSSLFAERYRAKNGSESDLGTCVGGIVVVPRFGNAFFSRASKPGSFMIKYHEVTSFTRKTAQKDIIDTQTRHR